MFDGLEKALIVLCALVFIAGIIATYIFSHISFSISWH
jgi:hypothetical protein